MGTCSGYHHSLTRPVRPSTTAEVPSPCRSATTGGRALLHGASEKPPPWAAIWLEEPPMTSPFRPSWKPSSLETEVVSS